MWDYYLDYPKFKYEEHITSTHGLTSAAPRHSLTGKSLCGGTPDTCTPRCGPGVGPTVTNTTNDQRPTDSTDVPTTNADAAALLEGVHHSADPGLTDDECERLDAVIAYLRGTDIAPITPSPSPYPTDSVATRAHGAANQAALASERVAGVLARHSHSLQAIARELGGEES